MYSNKNLSKYLDYTMEFLLSEQNGFLVQAPRAYVQTVHVPYRRCQYGERGGGVSLPLVEAQVNNYGRSSP